jgi:hypothetical protein
MGIIKDILRVGKPLAVCTFCVTAVVIVLLTAFHHSCKGYVYHHMTHIEIPYSVTTLESIYTEPEAFQKFLTPVTINYIRKNPKGTNYKMSFPMIGEEIFTVWRSATETKESTGLIRRELRKSGYDVGKIPE